MAESESQERFHNLCYLWSSSFLHSHNVTWVTCLQSFTANKINTNKKETETYTSRPDQTQRKAETQALRILYQNNPEILETTIIPSHKKPLVCLPIEISRCFPSPFCPFSCPQTASDMPSSLDVELCSEPRWKRQWLQVKMQPSWSNDGFWAMFSTFCFFSGVLGWALVLHNSRSCCFSRLWQHQNYGPMDWGLGAPNILYIKFKPSCSILDNVKPLDLTQNHVLSHWNIPLVHSDSLAMHPPAESSTKSQKRLGLVTGTPAFTIISEGILSFRTSKHGMGVQWVATQLSGLMKPWKTSHISSGIHAEIPFEHEQTRWNLPVAKGCFRNIP